MPAIEADRIDVSDLDGRTVVALRGDFAIDNAAVLRECLTALAAEHADVVIDLTDTTFMDSSVVHVLVAAQRTGLGITVRGRGPARRIIELMGLDAVFAIEYDAPSPLTS